MLFDWKSFYADLPFDILKAHCSHAVTPRWLDDAKECIQSAWSKQRDSPLAAGAGRLERCISQKIYLAIIAEQRELQTKGTFLLTEN